MPGFPRPVPAVVGGEVLERAAWVLGGVVVTYPWTECFRTGSVAQDQLMPASSTSDRRYVRALRRRALPCPAERAVAAVQDIKAIEQTELKADHVDVFPESPTAGTYAVTGRFARVPWRSRFAYRLHPTGFHSEKVRGERPRGWDISGGFMVAPIAERTCLVVHYEDYGLPRYLAPFRGLIHLYLYWSMGVELRVLAELVAGEGHRR
ncbi:MAG: hypothetical protein QOK04_428 [Solirubrobacteraceae bacterium]|jgi:hypothetical protein|nr:hypothetical protein [Solirubrobacteraceae bacterium]